MSGKSSIDQQMSKYKYKHYSFLLLFFAQKLTLSCIESVNTRMVANRPEYRGSISCRLEK